MHWPNGCLMIRLDWPTSTAPVCRKCGRNVLKLPVLLEFQQFLSFEKNAHRRLKKLHTETCFRNEGTLLLH